MAPTPPNLIAFTSVRLPYGWLGNMAPYPLEYEGARWRTSEALFQALRFGNEATIRELIRNEKSPMAAKMLAKKHHALMQVTPQSEEDLGLMTKVLELKLAQHPDLKTALVETGSAIIIEDCTKRPHGSGPFWGAVLQPDGSWLGQNVLGTIWMKLRSNLQ